MDFYELDADSFARLVCGVTAADSGCSGCSVEAVLDTIEGGRYPSVEVARAIEVVTSVSAEDWFVEEPSVRRPRATTPPPASTEREVRPGKLARVA
jgi:hypothetical protein